MANIPKTHEDIEAQIREIQSRKKNLNEEEGGENNTNKAGVGLGESGFYDREIYGGGKFEGYVTSIAANDEVDDDEYDPVSTFSNQKRAGYTAPAALLNDVAHEANGSLKHELEAGGKP